MKHARVCILRLMSLLLLSLPFSNALAQSATETTGKAKEAGDPLNDPAIESRVEALLKQMTLEEKIGQVNQYSAGERTGPGTGRISYDDMVARGQVGSLFNVTGAKETNAFQHIAVEKSRLHIPLIFGLDVIHGYHTIFPVPLAMASTWDPALVEQAARVAAQEASADGVRWTFSPMVDITRDARWGRIIEGAGEDPYLGQAMARAYVRGYQGAEPGDPSSIAACVKHYVGYGAAEGGRDYNTTEIPERLLRQVYLPPFRAAIDAGSITLMSAFNSLNEVPASSNYFTLTQILRKEWGFRGLVVSDWTSIRETMAHGIANDGATAARKSMNAGVDMDMESNLYFSNLANLIKAGQVSEERLDDAVRNILRVKFALGLFEHPYADESRPASTSLDPAHVELARTVAEKSLVLLKNQAVDGASLLPLPANLQKIALIGPLADSNIDMLGNWAGRGKPGDAVTLRSALSDWAQKHGKQVIYAKGTEIESAPDAAFTEALNAARQADIVLLALGENAAWMSGEAGSRAYLGLPTSQEQLMEAVVAVGKPVVLILFSGRPLAVSWAAEHVPAIVEAWFPGVQAGPALVRALFGETNFSGRLVTSVPHSVGQEPLYYNHLPTGRPATGVDLSRPPRTHDQKFKSRYYDEANDPLFPFGYGLSYTRFSYLPPTVSATTASARTLNAGGAGLRVSAEVKNIGDRAGEEVVQLYIRETGTSVSRPVRELKGFQKISLGPGESKNVEFRLGKDELSFWNIDMKNVVEPAKLEVWVAPNSAEGSPAVVEISE
ncbi:MAG TPA: glycoside hydrolase family 3 N-terminal domain-containing protein [Terriglobales bacterium]|nr:glycoside hydrolase family 3 N-terminal domain-containing protein [Terriglobales bacterium]